jgi:hypothetical protein
MNQKFILLIALLILSISCKSSKEKKYSNEEICKLISDLIVHDQKYRGNKIIVDPFFAVLDSIKQSEGLSNEMYGQFSTEKQLEYGRKARAIVNKRTQISNNLIDSLMILQENLDNKNTEILLKITKDIGYPNIDSLPCKKSPDLIFLHSQPKYFKEIKLLITKELAKGRINDFQYKMILRHIGGRKENNLDKVTDDIEIISF